MVTSIDQKESDMQTKVDQVTVFEPTKDVKSGVVDQMMRLSWERHLGFVDRGERGPLLFPEEIDGMVYFPEHMDKIVNKTKYHKEVYRRLNLIDREVPGLDYDVVIGHEIKEGPEWEEVKKEMIEKLKANKNKAKDAAKIIIPVAAVMIVGAVAIAVIASAATAAAAATAATATATAAVAAPSAGTLGAVAVVALVGLDPDYCIVVDGHWVSICNWLE